MSVKEKTEAQRSAGDATLRVTLHDESIVVALGGRWDMERGIPRLDPVERALRTHRPAQLTFDAGDLHSWDSALVASVVRICQLAHEHGAEVDTTPLPVGAQRLVAMVEDGTYQPASGAGSAPSLLGRVGSAALARERRYLDAIGFFGELTMAFGRMLTGRARVRMRDLMLQMQLAGAQALGVVALVSFLVGLILAFVGAVQLQTFGATVYVADLVGISIVRDMGAMMAAIVLAGRTGAAFAAELGTMRVTQEIDAFTTLGISPVEFLVLPRLVALTLMMPLLCIYADVLGVVGGGVVAVGAMDIRASLYQQHTFDAVKMSHLVGGLVKATVYGFLVAAAGCFEGLRSGRSAVDVGHAATSAVVDGIILVIAASGLFAVLFYSFGIE